MEVTFSVNTHVTISLFIHTDLQKEIFTKISEWILFWVGSKYCFHNVCMKSQKTSYVQAIVNIHV